MDSWSKIKQFSTNWWALWTIAWTLLYFNLVLQTSHLHISTYFYKYCIILNCQDLQSSALAFVKHTFLDVTSNCCVQQFGKRQLTCPGLYVMLLHQSAKWSPVYASGNIHLTISLIRHNLTMAIFTSMLPLLTRKLKPKGENIAPLIKLPKSTVPW